MEIILKKFAILSKKSYPCVLILAYFLFGASVDAADFPHGQAKHRTIECKACHSVSMKNPDVTRFPGHPACFSCHDIAKEVPRFQQFCGICHSAAPDSTNLFLFRFPPTSRRSEFGVAFSHVDHLKNVQKTSVRMTQELVNVSYRPEITTWPAGQAMTCSNCHFPAKSGVSGGAPDFVLKDAHANCFRCHGEKPVNPPSMNQCGGCHKLGGTTYTSIFKTVRGFEHTDHIIDIRPKKKSDLAGKVKVDLCSQCHVGVVSSDSLAEIRLPQASYCATCHTGKLGLPDPLSQDVLQILAKQ